MTTGTTHTAAAAAAHAMANGTPPPGSMPSKAHAPAAAGVPAAAAVNGNGATPPAANGHAAEPGKPADGAPAAARDLAAAGEAPETQESLELRRKEDEIAARGAEIAGVRALMAKAFTKPAEEPERPITHWEFLLKEAAWLAVDMSQERHYKRCMALALAFDIARQRGAFGLKPPPKQHRKYHDEIRDLRAAAAAQGAPPPASGRRSAAREAARAEAAAAATALNLNPADDPIFADLEAGAALISPGTPPLSELTISLVYSCEEDFHAVLAEKLMQSDMDRMIKEEIACRAHRMEWEHAMLSHQMAVLEKQRQENAIGIIDLGLGGLGPEEEAPEGEMDAAGKKEGKRRRGARGGAAGGGFLGLDDFGDVEMDGGAAAGYKRAASKALVEDVYLRKKRPQRTQRYAAEDGDYDASADAKPGYNTRRTTGALRSAQDRHARVGHRRGAVGGAGATRYSAQLPGGRPAGGHPGMALWSKGEDDLLLAIVHEFSLNWTLVSEVVSLSSSMQGVYRSPQSCRQRFRQVTFQEGVEWNEERAYVALSQQASKQHARELLMASLPVTGETLVRSLDALVQVGSNAKGRRQVEDRRNESVRTRRQDLHMSYMTVQHSVMNQTGGRHLSPLELAAHVNSTYLAQQRQQQMMAQQAAQMQAQQQQQHGGAPPPQQPNQQQQQPQQQQATGSAGMQPGMHPHQQAQQAGQGQGEPAQAPQLPQQPPQQQPGGGVLPRQGGVATGQPSMHGQPMQGMPQGAPGLTGPGVGSPTVGQQAGPGGAPLGVQKPPHPPQVTVHQLNQILASGKLPNGQELDDTMRRAIEAKRNAFVLQVQRQQAEQVQRQAAMAAGAAAAGAGPGQPGQATAASVAAMHASQAAALQAAAARPAMQQGMPAMQGMAFGVQPGTTQVQSLALPSGLQVVAQGLAPQMSMAGMLPAQQQQLMAQQLMQQQQQQQAAVAAAQAVAAAHHHHQQQQQQQQQQGHVGGGAQ